MSDKRSTLREGGDVSERPTDTSGDVMSAGRRRRRFRDLPIWSKLGVILIVPTLATLVVGVNGLVGHLETAAGVDRARALAELTSAAGDLVHGLQDERAAGVRLLGASRQSEQETAAATYLEAQEVVDRATARFREQGRELGDLPPSLQGLLTTVENQLGGLARTRNLVTARTYGLADTAATYSRLIENLISMREASAQFAGEFELGNRIRAAAALSRAKELLSQQRTVGHEVLIRGAYHPQLRNAFIGARSGHEQALQAFAAVATGAEQARLEAALEGPDVRQSQLYQDYLSSLDGTDLGDPPWDADGWDQVMSAHANLLRGLESELDQVIVQDANALYTAVTRRVLLEGGVLLLTLALAVLLAWSVARSMARSVRHLRQGALSVAQHGLPQAVARLRDPALAGNLSPAQIADQIAEPLPVRSRDEFGQLAEAFNAVHLAAVRTAAEQAQLRASVNTMFVNLARRSQILVDRLISHLDRLERNEQDPDRLAELFQLDHLATRMRRNDENLLVLAGADSTRVQRQPAALLDVLRAAQSEVEHYTRVEFGIVDRELQIVAHAVNDLVHLVAELLDNATSFSPPDSQVLVEARRVGDQAVLYVEDHGLGMSEAQLAEVNERLANPPSVDVAVSRMMGLVVVARLAARHGVTVELRPGPERGTIAEVVLPANVLTPRGGEATDQRGGRVDGQRPALTSAPSVAPSFPPFGPASADSEPTRRGRPLPAWSDLTGAAANNGAGDYHSGLVGGALTEQTRWAGGGPVREFASDRDGHTEHGRGAEFGSQSGAAGRGEEQEQGRWGGADTGMSADAPARSAGGSSQPLPRRRPGAGHTAADPAIPRPRQPETDSSGQETAWPSAAPPPAWPPLTPQSTTGEPTKAPAPSAEAPADASYQEQTGGREASPQPSGYQPSAPMAAPRVDETMELPIFRQVESVWFRARKPLPPPTEPGRSTSGTETVELATITSSGSYRATTAEDPDATTLLPLREPVGTVGDMGDPTGRNAANGDAMRGDTVQNAHTSASATTGPAAHEWRTAADEGWQAASQAAELPVQETTAAGLPKRRPMAQLVPGGVEKTTPPVGQRRSPEAVRGLLSAYHRGVQRGREQLIDPGRPNPGGSGSTEVGKERRT